MLRSAVAGTLVDGPDDEDDVVVEPGVRTLGRTGAGAVFVS